MKPNFPISLIIAASVAVLACEKKTEETSTESQEVLEFASLEKSDDAPNTPELIIEAKQEVLIEEPTEPVHVVSELKEVESLADSSDESETTIDYQFFNEALSPHGTWYDTTEYGSVWQPAACQNSDWKPYTRGQWVCSDLGWVWVSTEPFGWATYHYGRWALLQTRGWIWIPGTEWAPNWCTWRSNDTYIGWAPLPPETLAFPTCEWDSRVESQYGIGAPCFTFVRINHFHCSIPIYCLPARHNITCFHVTTNITRMRFVNGQIHCGGPAYLGLSERVGRPLPFCRIERNLKPIGRPNSSHFRSQIRGDRLVVASPRVLRTGVNQSRKRQLVAKVERSSTFDPRTLEAYRQMRQGGSRSTRVVSNPFLKPADRQPPIQGPVSRTGNPSVLNKPATRLPVARTGAIVRSSRPDPRIAANSPGNSPRERTLAGDQARASRVETRNKETLAKADRARRNQVQIATERQKEDASRRQQSEQEAQRKQRVEMQRRQQEEAQRRQRDEQQRQQAAELRRQRDEAQRRSQEEAQRRQRDEQQRQQAAELRRQRDEAQRRSQEEAQRRQRAEQQRQRADEQRRQQEQAQRRQEQAQRQQREEAQRRSQEEAQRRSREEAQQRQRNEQQRQREQGQRRQRGK